MSDRIRSLETIVAELVRQNDELRDPETFSIDAVAEYAILHGGDYYSPLDELVETIREWAWNHPDWFHAGILTDEGVKHIRLTSRESVGFVFYAAGMDAVLDWLEVE